MKESEDSRQGQGTHGAKTASQSKSGKSSDQKSDSKKKSVTGKSSK